MEPQEFDLFSLEGKIINQLLHWRDMGRSIHNLWIEISCVNNAEEIKAIVHALAERNILESYEKEVGTAGTKATFWRLRPNLQIGGRLIVTAS